jgi:amino acid adenylation domain-containing protein/non-ribosomal peptide synthase protein (TIGR01720 family)
MERQIAIIGMAGRFPNATSLEELHQNLLANKCSLSTISKDRIQKTTLPPKDEYKVRAYIENPDLFDYKLFNILPAEAQAMDPHQRLLLEVTYETIENAGLSVESLSSTNTSVYVADKGLDYYHLAEEANPLLYNGNGSEFLAARISRHFNLFGGVAVIDTSCSSSLVALHNACNDLILGDSDLAMVCGASLELFPFADETDIMGVESPDGYSIPFSDQSNGMTFGEAIAGVLLKPLDKAIADDDIIHGVIMSTAVNNNAGRSASLNAPDSVAQADVILKAWEKAGINALDLDFIEVHGSGTQLGDSIEVGGLNIAFNEFTKDTEVCPISSIKANIGHTRCVAGLSGLFKVVLSLKNKVIYPALYTGTSSPLIDFSNSAVYINQEAIEWSKAEGEKRYAGLSSMGFSGTNCHVVLTEAPPRKATPAEEPSPFFIPVSSKTPQGLRDNLEKLRRHLTRNEESALADISHTYINGRSHFPCRSGFVVDSKGQLQQQLEVEMEALQLQNAFSTEKLEKVILILSDLPGANQKLLQYWGQQFPAFKAVFSSFETARKAAKAKPSDAYYNLSFQVAYATLLKSTGVAFQRIIGTGIGRLAAEVVSDQRTIDSALASIQAYPAETFDNVKERVERLIEAGAGKNKTLFLGLCSNQITQELNLASASRTGIMVYENQPIEPKQSFWRLIDQLYRENYSLSFGQLSKLFSGQRTELPTYQFAKTRCWIRETPVSRTTETQQPTVAASPEVEAEADLTTIQKLIAASWKEVIGLQQVTKSDHFFNLGGDSLQATKVINHLNDTLGIDLNFEDIFDFPVLEQLASFIEDSLGAQQKLMQAWKEVLKEDQISITDNFFEIGGHSLLANQILNRIRSLFNLQLNFEDFFLYPTVNKMSNYIDSRLKEEKGPSQSKINKLAPQDHYDLSNAQKRIWILCQMEETSAAYTELSTHIIEGEINRPQLEKALTAVVERHESLRTIFVDVNGEAKQQILSIEDAGYTPEFIDLSQDEQTDESIQQQIEDYQAVPLDLEKGPLFQTRIIRLTPTSHLLVIKVHHIIFDDWSLEVIGKEILALYEAFCKGAPNPLPPLKFHYKDFASWMNRQLEKGKVKKMKDYWLNQFKDEIPILDLPTEFPRPNQKSYKGGSVVHVMQPEQVARLRAVSLAQGSSIFMTMMAALKALLYRYTSQNDVVIGVPVAGREFYDLEDQVGFYANTLPIRTKFETSNSFEGLLQEVKQNILSAYEFQLYPFDMLVGELNPKTDLSRSPLFDILAVYKKGDFREQEQEPVLQIQDYSHEITGAKFDLSFAFFEAGDYMGITIVYNQDLYSEKSAQRLSDHFANLLNHALEQPQAAIQDLNYLSEEETKQILEDFSLGKPAVVSKDYVHTLIERWAIEKPEALAVLSDDGDQSYLELNRQADRIAHYLREELKLQTHDRVAVLMERSVALVSTILGILKAGCTYVPVLSSYPDERINFMIADSEAKALIIKDESFLKKYQLKVDTTIFIGDLLATYRPAFVKEPGFNYEPSPIASVLYTSGSTGIPKGVQIEHDGLINRIEWMCEQFGFDESDVMLQRTNYVFDVSILELFLALCGGCKLVMASDAVIADTFQTILAIERYGVTNINTTPSEYNSILDILSDITIPKVASLKYVFSAGEALLEELVKKHYSKLNAELWNLYGPTEASVIVSYYKTHADDDFVPIGKPLHGVSLQILDKNLQLTPIGVWGEIHISGIGLAKGYLNRPETTIERFFDNPYGENEFGKIYKTGDIGRWMPDGNIEFMGRKDFQIKINGYRIELGEIENTILKFDQVKEVAVIVTQKSPEVKLTAYLVRKEDKAVSNGQAQLPEPVVEEIESTASPKISEEDILTLHRFNQTDLAYPDQKAFFDLFEESAQKHPDNIAVTQGKRKFTYTELHQQSLHLAAQLLSKGVQPEDCVTVFCDRSVEMLTAILALFKVGGVYVPVNPDLPKQRIHNIINDCQPACVLMTASAMTTRQKHYPNEGELFPNVDSFDINNLLQASDANFSKAKMPQILPSNLAYIIFTSGSTGRPKGAMIEHAGMINHLYAKVNELEMKTGTRLVQNASQNFDISVWQFLSALLVGGTTLIYDDATVQNPEQFATQLKADRPDILEVVPTYLSALLDIYEESTEYDAPDSLNYLMVTGEVLKKQLVDRWFNAYPAIPLVNAYGPTEASDDITHCFIHESPKTAFVPIGKPVQNLRIYIVDEQMNLCPIGVKGEICVSGVGVGRGYLKRPDLTEKVFIKDPFLSDKDVRLYKTGDLANFLPDGNIQFHGRKDEQVKVRGHRIELGEVEHALLSLADLKDAVVTVKEDVQHNKILCAYVLSMNEAEDFHADEIKCSLHKRLPWYMVPAHIILLESFPLTPNGKIDKKSLPDPLKIENNRHFEGEIRDLLLSQVPAHMVPGAFHTLDKLPYTGTGKIDRKTLSEMKIVKQHGSAFEMPSNDIERKLLVIWKKILERERISITDNFFDIGGHSLKSGRVATAIYQELRVKLSIREIFINPTIKALAKIIKASQKEQYESIPAITTRVHYELSHAQRRMWILNNISHSAAVYNIFNTATLKGKVDAALLEKAFQTLIKRHESLRTSFVQIGEAPKAKVLNPADVSFRLFCHDLSNQPSPQKIAKDRAAYLAAQPFDLATPPLLRAELLQTGTEEYVFTLVIHHIIADGWSLDILVAEVFALYEAYIAGEKLELTPLRIQYRDFASWQNEKLSKGKMSKEAKFWLNKFEEPVPTLELSTDFPRKAVKTFAGGSTELILEKASFERLSQLAKETYTTMFMNVTAVVNALLYQYTGQNDIVIGTPTAGRNHPDLENQIGLYINTLALRSQFQPDNNYWELLHIVKDNALQAYEHQSYPFDKLVDSLQLKRDLSRSPLFDVMVVHHNIDLQSKGQQEKASFSIHEFPVENSLSKFDLTFHFTEMKDKLSMGLSYNSDLFTAETANTLLLHLKQIILSAVADPKTSIQNLNYLSTSEKELVTNGFNATEQTGFPEESIKSLFETTAAKHPGQEALYHKGKSISYQALNAQANQIAHYLQQQHQVKAGQVVALQMERSPDMIAALLAIIKTGAAYLPVDITFPDNRVNSMLSDAQPALLIRQSTKATTASCAVWDFDAEAVKDYSSGNIQLTIDPESVIYTIYTSGSTGKPKGVRIAHRSLANYISWFRQTGQIKQEDRSALFSTIAFDLCYTSLWSTLLSGACLHLLEENAYLDTSALIKELTDHPISFLKLTPSHFYLLVNDDRWESIASQLKLRLVVLGGEKIRPEDIERYYHYADKSTLFINHYGPTETTIGIIAQPIVYQEKDIAAVGLDAMDFSSFSKRPVIGKPISNNRVFILNQQLQLQGIGVAGELCLSGKNLALGYTHNNSRTEEKFISHPDLNDGAPLYRTGDLARWLPDGTIEFLGRIDSQVKVRGYRVELGEIEKAINQHPDVQKVAVTTWKNEDGFLNLAAYVVAPPQLNAAELQAYLAPQLPAYMIPTCIVHMEVLPLTANGKVATSELPDPKKQARGKVQSQEGQTTEEQLLFGLTAELLGQETVSPNDDFFWLGGDSIKAIQLSSRLYNKGYKLEVRDVFGSSILANMVKQLKPIKTIADQGVIKGIVPLTPIQRGFFDRQLKHPHHYNHSVMVFSEEAIEASHLEVALSKLVLHHDALRLSFLHNEDGKVVQVNQGEECKPQLTVVDHRQEKNAEVARLAVCQEVQGSFQLDKAPLIKAVLFQGSDGDRILLVVHHLLVDGISWRILLEDLNTLYSQASQSKQLELPVKTDSFKAWAEDLMMYAKSKEFEKEIPFWRNLAMQRTSQISHPASTRASHNLLESFEIDPELTKLLVGPVHHAYSTEINDVLLAALSAAIHDTFDSESVSIMLEGHGREEILDSVQITRTLGWFTSMYPFILSAGKATADLSSILIETKESLRKIPHHGIGFGIARYLSPEKLDWNHSMDPEIVFNYWGQFDEAQQDAGLHIIDEFTGNTQSEDEAPHFGLTITGIITDQKLKMELRFDEAKFDPLTIQKLSRTYQAHLEALIHHCTGVEEKVVTPSDLGYKELSTEDFSNFFE